MTLFRAFRTAILALFLVASLTLNVASVAFDSVATMIAVAYTAVTGARAITAKLKNQISSKDRKLAKLDKTIATKNTKIASLTDDVAKLNAKRSVVYRGKKQLISAAVEDTTSRVARRTLRDASRNVGSLFFEAIPIAGAGVVIGVTAWELRDACETMGDLHELNLAFNPQPTDARKAKVCGMSVPTLDSLKDIIFSRPDKAVEAAQARADAAKH